MTRIENFQRYVGTHEQLKARIEAKLEKDMEKSGLKAQFDGHRKALAELPKLNLGQVQFETTVKPKQSIVSRIIPKALKILKK